MAGHVVFAMVHKQCERSRLACQADVTLVIVAVAVAGVCALDKRGTIRHLITRLKPWPICGPIRNAASTVMIPAARAKIYARY